MPEPQAVFSDAQLLGAIVDTSEDAIVSKTATGYIVAWNPAAERLFGYPAAEAIGRHISIIIPADRLTEEEGIMRRLLAGERILRFETVRQRKDGQAVPVELSISPVHDAAGTVIGGVKIARDLRERIAARDALKQEKERLRDVADELTLVNRRKDEFLAALSHEIRNPLGAIRSGMAVIKLGQLDAAAAARTHAMVERQLSHVVQLLDDLLDVSRSTHDRLTVSLSDIDARAVIEDAVAVAGPLFEAAGVTLRTTLPDHPLPVRADAARLQQMLVNVLSNAARYTPSGGHAELAVTAGEGTMTAVVSDSGVGIPADFLPQVFDLFAQRQPDAAAASTGLGIGLYLTRALALRHGGTISAESDGPGLGSRFTIQMPMPASSSASGLPVDSTPPADDGAETTAATRRVLVVDDDRDNAEGLATLIQLSGHQTEMAHDGPAALETARVFQPDVILLDIGLPGMDGFEICRALRTQTTAPQPFIVAITGWGQPADYERTKAAGFDCHLVKPVEPQRLLALLVSRQAEYA